MSFFVKIFLVLLLIGVSSGCSVRDAFAPTNPPSVTKKDFRSADLAGSYQHGGSTEPGKENERPTTFLWPEQRLDENSGQLVAMSLDEQASVRQKIGELSDQIAVYKRQGGVQEFLLKQKYDPQILPLEAAFTSQACYSFCDTNENNCNPDDDSVLVIEQWKTGATPEEQTIIDTCKENQSSRTDLAAELEQEFTEKVVPIKQLEGQTTQQFAGTIGRRNFLPIAVFAFSYDPTKANSPGQGFAITVNYAGLVTLSSVADTDYKLSDVSFDAQNGFLTFKMPALALAEGEAPKVYGEIAFDLEFTVDGPTVKLKGDVRLQSQGVERVGRFSSYGNVKPL